MCGIVGYWNFQGQRLPSSVFDRYVDSLAHRGPGSRGVWHDRVAALSLGHRRLAIFDLSDRGHQPMSYGDGRYWITFNGEIYNYLELRQELSGLGHSFKSTCDTEVILAAWAQWGQECLLRFNGIWAFAIWDAKERRLFAARDHFGFKPFHYTLNGRSFAFASEMKAFLALPDFQVRFDETLVAENIANVNGLEGTEYCLLRGVRRLPAGHCLTIQSDGSITKRRWWRTIDHLPVRMPQTEADQVEHLRELLFDACRLRLRSDLPVVATLSGGLDSSAITSVASTLLRQQGMPTHFQQAYVASFPGTNQEETPYAQAVADYHQLSLTVRTIDHSRNLEGMVDDIIWHHEDIYWVLPASPWLMYQDIHRQHNDIVVLDGAGGDEVALGHHFFAYAALWDALLHADGRRWREVQGILGRMRGGSVEHIPTDLPYVIKQALMSTRLFARHLLPAMANYLASSPLQFLLAYPDSPRLLSGSSFVRPVSFSRLQHAQYVWAHFTGMPTISRTYDRGASAQGVAVRAPFLDWRIMAFCLALPDEMKLGHGYTKYVIRQAMRGLMPEYVRLRTSKVGFTSPMNTWLAGPLKSWLLATITDRAFLASNIWDGPRVAAYIRACVAQGAWDHAANFWPLLHAYHSMRLFQAARRPVSV